jgi:putative glutamine amidotransferase
MDPARFGQKAVAETEPAMPHDDDLDLAAAAAALALGLPTLAICRGLQVVNVLCGGTLHQHLAPGSVEHRAAIHRVTATGRLRQIVGREEFDVSSYHHQAVDRVGAGLSVAARAADGCIEALEHDAGTLLAVQWHPEDLCRTHPTDAALFTDLVERAAKHATREDRL